MQGAAITRMKRLVQTAAAVGIFALLITAVHSLSVIDRLEQNPQVIEEFGQLYANQIRQEKLEILCKSCIL